MFISTLGLEVLITFEHLIIGKQQSKKGVDKLSALKKEQIAKAWKGIGIELDKNKWQVNPSFSTFCKLFLNSLW